jgi:hypothetical protein
MAKPTSSKKPSGNNKTNKTHRNTVKKTNRLATKKYVPGVDGPKYVGGSVAVGPLGKVVKTKQILDVAAKKTAQAVNYVRNKLR